jgi:drug/metabolite transporter (DMT)-like permease
MSVPRRVVGFLALGLLAASQSGNIVRLGAAHPVAIAAWRLGLAALVLALAAGGQLRLLGGLRRGERALLLAAGAVLATHFFAWIAAVQQTTVANAALFFAVNPVITALAARLLFGERLGWRLFVSIAFGLAGVAVIGSGDLDLERSRLAGDLWALLSAALFSAYFLLGKRLRRSLPNLVYVSGMYGAAALVAWAALLLLGLPAVDYDSRTWLCFVLMALVPTLIGHTSFNSALKYLPAGRVAAATLTEPLLAGLGAWMAWNEPLTLRVGLGYALIVVSVSILVWDAR